VRLFARSLVLFFSTVFYLIFFVPSAFALTTPFRSANIVTTNGVPAYTSLSNCSVTDGLTCDRALANSYANLYFRDFGTYEDFGMLPGSVITKIRIRVTGKASSSLYVGLSSGTIFQANCQWPSYLWTLWQLNGSIINSQTFITSLEQQSYVNGTVLAYCLRPYNFENKNFIFIINYASPQNWSANIDNFEIAFDYVSAPIPIPTPAPTSTPTPTPKTPLILIPGIGGSELKVAEDTYWLDKDDGHDGKFNYIYPKDEVVWVNESKMGELGEDDYYDVLRMKTDGIISEANIGASGNLVARAYQGTIDFFKANGYTLNKDFFVFPYDWRKDISLTAPLLDQKINEIKTQTGNAKVDIIAHSMGGLVARNYISDATRASTVRKLFTLGTPHLGSVDSLRNLRYGACLTPLPISLGPLCLGLIDTETNDVVQNMISVFQLAPSQAYFNFYSGQDNYRPYPYKTESGALNYNQIKNLLTDLGHNTTLFNPSEIFHSLDDSISNTNSVDVIVIAGSGRSTLGQIIEEKRISLLGIPYIHKDMLNINGDQTVPLFSASLIDHDRDKSLLGGAKIFYTNQKHGELVASGSALNLVKNILDGNSQLPDGVSTQAASLPSIWWIFSVHSPVNMNIYDSSGNHTGPTDNGDFEENIPGSSYSTLDDAKFIFIPNNGNYNIKFEATDQGSFDFKIRKYNNDENTETILYKEIPLTETTKAETQFDTQSSEIPIIRVDQNGDGNFDFNAERFSILEGNENYDFTPPAISFSVDPKFIWPANNEMVDVRITVKIIDENPYLITILVDDEYDLIEPSIAIQNETNINQMVRLEASRIGDDKDGRTYKIKILATDLAGNTSLSATEVIVPHDQRE